MTNDEILELAHREAWRYRKSSDPHHSDTYTFNRSTLLEFARKLAAQRGDVMREALKKIAWGNVAEHHISIAEAAISKVGAGDTAESLALPSTELRKPARPVFR